MDWHFTENLPDLDLAPMQQHAAYGRACADLGAKVAVAVAGPASAPVAAAQILIRRWPLFGDFALVARGPVWIQPAAPDEAQRATCALAGMLKRRFRGAILTPDPIAGADPLAKAGLLPLVTPGAQAVLPLNMPPASRMARQHGKWRNRLRRAQAGNLRIHHMPMPANAGHWLLQAETTQARQRRYKRLPSEFTRAWIAANGPGSSRLFLASLRGEPVAAMLFLLYGQAANYHVGWSGQAGRERHAHNLLLWEAGNWLAGQGYLRVDLGTLDTENTAGLARFKLGAGADAQMLGTTWLDAPGARMMARAFRWQHTRGRPSAVSTANAPGRTT